MVCWAWWVSDCGLGARGRRQIEVTGPKWLGHVRGDHGCERSDGKMASGIRAGSVGRKDVRSEIAAYRCVRAKTESI